VPYTTKLFTGQPTKLELVNINSIQDVIVYSNSRLKITPHIKWEPKIIVSREKVSEFKEWFDCNH
jgi:hypothetical protein